MPDYLTENDEDEVWEGAPDPATLPQRALAEAIFDWLQGPGAADDDEGVQIFEADLPTYTLALSGKVDCLALAKGVLEQIALNIEDFEAQGAAFAKAKE